MVFVLAENPITKDRRIFETLDNLGKYTQIIKVYPSLSEEILNPILSVGISIITAWLPTIFKIFVGVGPFISKIVGTIKRAIKREPLMLSITEATRPTIEKLIKATKKRPRQEDDLHVN